MHSIGDYQRRHLRDGLDAHFDLAEIRSLCFDLAVDYDNLDGSRKRAKIECLIGQLSKQDRLGELIERAAELRPAFQWRVGPTPDAPTPYKGLFAFQEEDAGYFFGRESFAQTLADAIDGRSLVALLGASGSGKSSVVFAGLIPRLRSGGDWLIAHFRPGKEPFTALATAVVPLLEPEMSKTDRQIEVRKMSRAWQEGDLTLADSLSDILAEEPAGTRLLLMADQFEELYTLVPDAEQRHRFLDTWLCGQRAQGAHLLLTMRADFLGQALAYRPLAEVLQQDDLKLAPMSAEDLQATIERPAAKAGVAFESGLVERILEEIEDEPGNLPLLQFALTLLWERQSEGLLTHNAYEEIGAVGGALAQYADEVYGRLEEEERLRTRRVFVQLVQPGAGVEDTRRRATAREVGRENWELVAQLATERLVVTGEDEHNEQTVEVIHEALIQQWGQLQLWMGEDRAFRTWQENLRHQMARWRASGEDEGGLLRGGLLAEAERWLGERATDLSEGERVYIEAGVALHQREIAAEERNTQRLRRRLYYLGGALAFAAIAALLAIFFGISASDNEVEAQDNLATATAALISAGTSEAEARNNLEKATVALVSAATSEAEAQYNLETATVALIRAATAEAIAESQLATAEAASTLAVQQQQTAEAASAREAKAIAAEVEAQKKAHLEDARALAAQAESAIFRNDAKSAYLLAIQAVETTYENDGSFVAKAESALYHALELPFWVTLVGHMAPVNSASFNHDDSRIVTASDDGTARLWDSRGQPITALEGHTSPVNSASFNHDGSQIVTASDDGTARLWDPEGQITATLLHTDKVNSASFNHDGSQIVTAGDDGKVRLWDPEGKLIAILEGHEGAVNSASFNHDGSQIVTAGDDGKVRLWDPEGKLIAILEGQEGAVNSASFSDGGRYIVTAGPGDTAQVLDLEGKLIQASSYHNGIGVRSASISRGRIMTASADGTVRLSGFDGQYIPIFLEHSHAINSASINHDGSRIVTASDDGTARLWDLEGGWFIRALEGNTGPDYSASFNHDGSRIVTVGCVEKPEFSNCSKWAARLWDSEGQFITTFLQHPHGVNSASFNHDGSRIVTASDDGTARLWDSEGRPITILQEHPMALKVASFSHDGSRIMTASDDGKAWLWDSEGRFITTFSSEEQDRVLTASFNHDGSRIMMVSIYGTVGLWDSEGRFITTFSLEGQNYVSAASFNHDGSRIVTAGCENLVICQKWSVRLWDLEGQLIAFLEGHEGGVNSASFNYDGSRIVTAGPGNTAQLWGSEGQLITTLEHPDWVSSASFNHDGSRIVTASSDGTVRLWEAWTGIDRMLAEAKWRLSFLMAEE